VKLDSKGRFTGQPEKIYTHPNMAFFVEVFGKEFNNNSYF
jgi:hypothetical protein